MRLEEYLTPAHVLVIDDVDDRDALFERFAGIAASSIESVDEAMLTEALVAREEKSPTSTPERVAFPHAIIPEIDDTLLVVALLKKPIDFGRSDHAASDLIFCFFGSSARPWDHLRLLARLSRVASAPGALERMRGATDASDLLERLIAEDRLHV